MRITILCAALLLGGCSIFSTPGRVTSQEGTSDAGGVYMHIVQPASGKGCPSAIAFGAQTMGSIDATCSDNGATQSIHATAPDPNPALTTAYAGINQQMATMAALIQSIMASVAGAGGKVATGGLMVAPPMRPGAVRPAPALTTPMMVCPTGMIIGLSNGMPVCQ